MILYYRPRVPTPLQAVVAGLARRRLPPLAGRWGRVFGGLATIGMLGAAAAGAMPQQPAPPDSSAPSEIEEALTEYACRQGRPRIKPYTEGWDACVSAHLESLRTAFGTNLKRLTETERRTVDSVCYRMRADREVYLQCLTDQLTGLSTRKNRGRGTPASGPALTAAMSPPDAANSAATMSPGSAPMLPAETPARSGHLWIWLVGGVAAVAAVAAGGMPILWNTRHATRRCQVCGSVEEPGLPSTGGVSAAPARGWRAWLPTGGARSGLCLKCRREAADAVRKAAQEREERRQTEERAEEEAQRQRRELQEALFQNNERRTANNDQLAVTPPASPPAEQAPNATPTQTLALATGAPDLPAASLDLTPRAEDESPFAILNVRSDASQEVILAAYEAAKAKYDPSLVDGLGDEVRAHFTARREAVEQAYQALSSKLQ